MVNRKIILVILTLLLALSAAISSSASETLTKEDAESLIDTAAQLRMALGARLFQWFEDDADPVTVYENSSVNGKEGETQFTLYPVREGYNPDGLRALAAATLTEEYAAYVLAHYDGIFRDYREIDGKWYCIKWGIQTGYDEPVKRRDTSESIRILEETGDAARVEVKILPDGVFADVYFEKENGAWKIAGYDCRNLLFTCDPGKIKSQELTFAAAQEGIEATVKQLYYWTCVDDTATDTFLLGYGTYNHNLEASLSDPEVWREYASSFMTDSLVDKVVRFDRILEIKDGRVVRGNSGTNDAQLKFVACFENHWPPAAEDITIHSSGENLASVKYTMKFPDGDKELNFEFSKTDGTWKVAGGDFPDMLDVYCGYSSEPAPETGDLIFLVPVIVFLAALATVFKRQKPAENVLR